MEQLSGFGAALGRRCAATWRSYRALPTAWQAVVAVILLLVLVSAGDRPAKPADVSLASKQVASAPAPSDPPEEASDAADTAQLREQVADAEARADRAEAQRARAIERAEAVASRLRNKAENLGDVNDGLRENLSDVRSALGVARCDASELKNKLAAASSASTAPAVASVAPVQPAKTCHSSYKGACVPITSDVDCAGGSGDGPAYVGYVQVVGYDEYDLDSDGDGDACEEAFRS
jgi:hypothetical protein